MPILCPFLVRFWMSSGYHLGSIWIHLVFIWISSDFSWVFLDLFKVHFCLLLGSFLSPFWRIYVQFRSSFAPHLYLFWIFFSKFLVLHQVHFRSILGSFLSLFLTKFKIYFSSIWFYFCFIFASFLLRSCFVLASFPPRSRFVSASILEIFL